MFKEERFQQILGILQEKEYVSVNELSRLLYVSEPTVRRDLTEMTKLNMVIRSRGGVMSIAKNKIEMPVDFRNGINSHEKSVLARAASELIKNNSVIYIDSSTTVLHIVNYLRDLKGITVVTNNIQAAMLLRKYNIKLYCLGGMLLGNSMAFGGSMAEKALEYFNFDIMLFSSYGISTQGQIVDYSEPENVLRAKAMHRSATTVFLCDKSKFGRRSIYNLAYLDEVDYLILDAPLPPEIPHPVHPKIIIAQP